MDKQQLIDRLKRLVDYAEAMPMDSVMENFTVKELKDWIRLLEQEQEIKQQCMNAFAAGIMRSDEDVTGKTLPELFDEFWKLNAPELI